MSTRYRGLGIHSHERPESLPRSAQLRQKRLDISLGTLEVSFSNLIRVQALFCPDSFSLVSSGDRH